MAPGTMEMVSAGGASLALVRTEQGVYALDNACPHQGYGLTTGTLGVDGDGEPVITCLWHNWKFRVRDGVCVLGEEDVPCHPVSIDDSGTLRVSVQRRTPDEEQARLWPSLAGAIERHYVGQLARDTVRLLDTGVAPSTIMAAALGATAARTEDGVGHEVALAADCLAIAEDRDGDERVLPLVIGLSGLSEETRDRPLVEAAAVDDGDLVEAIEREDVAAAMGRAATLEPEMARPLFVEAAARHHLGYGHGVIYTQKVFEVLERTGAECASTVLPQLARSLAVMTREDLLPYMRKTARTIAELDLESLAASRRTAESIPDELVTEFLDRTDPGIDRAVELAHDGLGVEGLLDLASLGSARRMLRYDTGAEHDASANFGWLDITHGLTHARAVRWAWHHEPGPHTARMALHAIWLLFDTGRLERRRGIAPAGEADTPTDLVALGQQLIDDAMDDSGGSFIVVAHLVKTVRAAIEEAAATGSSLPVTAAQRFIHGQRRERFVARNATEALRFVRSGRPPRR